MTTSTAAAHVLTTGVLDESDAITLLEQVVNEKGADHTVRYCTYFDVTDTDLRNDPDFKGDPMCIVGHVFDKLGKGIQDLSHVVGPYPHSASRVNDTQIASIAVDGLIITPRATIILEAAQQVQDGNGRSSDTSWGAALEAARKSHELVAA